MSFKKLILSTAAVSAGLSFSAPAQAGVNPYIGEVMLMANNFCPRGWAIAEGQLLAVSSHDALFSLYGTIYGGDGRTTFGLPDLRGRAIINDGSGAGLPTYQIGQRTGTEQFTMTATTMPSHTHQGQLRAFPSAGNSTTPVRNTLAVAPAGQNVYSTGTPANNMNAGDLNILNAGGQQAVTKRSPFLTLQYCVALVGTYPSRN